MKRTLATVLFLSLVPFPVTAQTAPPGPSMESAVAAIAAYGPRALAEQGAPGMTVAITDRTHTIKILTFGYSDVASKTAVTDATRFPIGSISKSMTALALLQLHDRGLVNLNAPVRKYLPWWALQGGDGISVHQLLSHTGGVPDDYTVDGSWGYEVAALRHAHTIFKPGTSWSYSNDGFATVGAISEAVTGKTWQSGIETTVFAPLGMTHSSAAFTAENMADVATGYIFRASDQVAIPPHPDLMPVQAIDFVNPAGSVLSTPGDMAAYMRFFLNGGAQLLKPATFAAMTSADRYSNGKAAGAPAPIMAEWPSFYRQYGYGLGIFNTRGDHLIGHTGGISGYTACMQMNLTQGFGVIAMSNLVEAPLHPCAIVKYAMDVLRAQKLGQPIPDAPTTLPIAAPKIDASQYAGTYRNAAASITVNADGSALHLIDRGTTYHLDPRGDDRFWSDDPRFNVFYVAFTRDKNRFVDGFTHGANFYPNSRYTGPATFPHPATWDALTGRYEANLWGTPEVLRIVIVKGRLTVDGIAEITKRKDGSYALGDSVLRFDTMTGGKTQRMWLDGTELYRVTLP